MHFYPNRDISQPIKRIWWMVDNGVHFELPDRCLVRIRIMAYQKPYINLIIRTLLVLTAKEPFSYNQYNLDRIAFLIIFLHQKYW